LPRRKNNLELVSIRVGAQLTTLSEKTLRRYVSDGRLHAYRVGRKLLRIDLNELQELIKPVSTAHRDAS
jgi:excisionase family DNA binding protein